MKRFLLLFCTVVLVCSIMVVPAFAVSAANSYQIDFNDGVGWMSSNLPVGTYRVVLNVDGAFVPLENNILEVTSDFVENYFFTADNSGNRLYIRLYGPADGFDSGIGVEFLNSDDVQIQGSVGFVRIADPSEPEPVKETFLESVGTFFTQSIAWLGAIAGVVTNSPALLVVVIGMIIAGAIIGYLNRLKNM